jgi:hypothetical protein
LTRVPPGTAEGGVMAARSPEDLDRPFAVDERFGLAPPV